MCKTDVGKSWPTNKNNKLNWNEFKNFNCFQKQFLQSFDSVLEKTCLVAFNE
jgi:hypothetical protein